MTLEQKIALWDAINRVVFASGGDPENTSVARQKAVVEVEHIIEQIVYPEYGLWCEDGQRGDFVVDSRHRAGPCTRCGRVGWQHRTVRPLPATKG